jgi:uncharacterized protein (TIGR01244 family)
MQYRGAFAILGLVFYLAGVSPALAQGSKVTKEAVPGVTNFARLETTVACGGATKAEAVPAIKQMGFKAIINVREKTEPGAEMDKEEAAAKAAGLNFINIPFVVASPAPDLADRFLAEIVKPENTPAFIHCAGGGRAATLWAIKRVKIDGWDEARAFEEATALGMSERTKSFAIEYLKTQKR